MNDSQPLTSDRLTADQSAAVMCAWGVADA